MASSFPSFQLCVLFVTLCTSATCARDDSHYASRVFFRVEDLKVGNKLPIYFKINSPYRNIHSLPKEKADSIPFSSEHLSQILNLFSVPQDSPYAKLMELALQACEREPGPGETKFCATSSESMMESVLGALGLDTHINALTTKLSPEHKIAFQNYTVLGEPEFLDAYKQLGCHILPYPYKVYFCHTRNKDHIIYKIPMVGDDGERIEVLGSCHTNTASFDPNHVAFKVLKTKPGSIVCHVIQADDFFFVVSPSTV